MYKDKVEESQDKLLELFPTKVEVHLLRIDLNRHASSPMHDWRVEVYVSNSSSQPPSSQPNEAEMNAQTIVIQEKEVEAIGHGDNDAIAHGDSYAEAE